MRDTTAATIRSVVGSIIRVPEEEMTLDRDLKAMGADSIDRVEIISELRRVFHIEMPLAQFAEIPNLAALAEFCDEHGQGES